MLQRVRLLLLPSVLRLWGWMAIVLRVVGVLLHILVHGRLRRVVILLWVELPVMVLGGRARMIARPSSPFTIHRCW